MSRGLVNVAIGSGPHVAEAVAVVNTPRGSSVLNNSVDNFIHTTLSSQPNNVVLQTTWSFEPLRQQLRFYQAKPAPLVVMGKSVVRVQLAAML